VRKYRGLRPHGSDRDEIVEDVKDDRDHVAATLGIARWNDHVAVS
jgi:hypothetical protein